MCGRTACTLSGARMRHVANISAQKRAAAISPAAAGCTTATSTGEKNSVSGETPLPDFFCKKFNISPTGVLPIVVQRGDTGERQILLAEWGLRPPTHQLPSSPSAAKPAAFPYSSFNARVEGVTTSKLYKRLLNSRRCVLVVDGFYEWKKDPSDPKKKQPFFIRMRPAVREMPIPLRRENKIAKEHHSSVSSSSSSYCCPSKSSTTAEQHEHVTPHTRQPAGAAGADDDGEQQQQEKQEHQQKKQKQSIPPSYVEDGKRRRGESAEDVKCEPSRGGSTTPTTAAEVKKEAAFSSSSSGEPTEGDSSDAQAAGDQREKAHVEGGKKAEDGEKRGTLQRGEAPLLLAGLYDFLYTATAEESSCGEEKHGSSNVSCSVTILTMSSKGTPLEDLHMRVPVALSPEAAAVWLDCASTPFDACVERITTGSTALYRNDVFFYAVTPRVGNSKYEAPDCTEPLAAGGATKAAAAEKKQQFFLFCSRRGGEAKRLKHEEAAEQQEVKNERQQVMKTDQQQQVKKEQQNLSDHQRQQHVEKVEEKKHGRGSCKDSATRRVGQERARSVYSTGMNSMDHYFKRAAPRKQGQ